MIKKFSICTLGAICLVISISVNLRNNDKLSDLTIANIEALASGEGPEYNVDCARFISDDPQKGKELRPVRYCGSCEWELCYYSEFIGSCSFI